MIYGSVCSGIEGATVAWHRLGWKPAFFSEIEAFPRAVLAYHYPDVPCHGDFTTIGDEYGAIDLLVGGTPCQAFSVAGLRKGFNDHRGNLTLEFVRLAQRKMPKWLVWENVPGVLSIDGGRAFGSFLGGLAECGYGFAYRVLDAQYFGVPQRRRRVFVVGCLRDWRSAAKVLFEPESLRGDLTPRGEQGQGIRSAHEGRTTRGKHTFGTLMAKGNQDALSGDYHVFGIPGNWIGRKPENGGNAVEPMTNLSPCLTTTDRHGVVHIDGGYTARTLTARHDSSATPTQGMNVIAHTLTSNGDAHSGFRDEKGLVLSNACVRRLTPLECERLQGFSDGYTDIKQNGNETPDGQRYKALGNSMAVPVMRWIGERIDLVDNGTL